MTRDEILQHIISVEGGYVFRAEDHGGPTKYGITKATLEKYCQDTHRELDIESLPAELAKDIYVRFFWNPMQMSLIADWQAQLVIFDLGVNRGQSRAIKQMQAVVNTLTGPPLITDGIPGPDTIRHLNKTFAVEFCREFQQRSRMTYVQIVVNDPTQIIFLKGWIERTHICDDLIFGNQS